MDIYLSECWWIERNSGSSNNVFSWSSDPLSCLKNNNTKKTWDSKFLLAKKLILTNMPSASPSPGHRPPCREKTASALVPLSLSSWWKRPSAPSGPLPTPPPSLNVGSRDSTHTQHAVTSCWSIEYKGFLGLTGLQLPVAAGILMARDQEQTLCWQTSWPPGALVPPAVQRWKTKRSTWVFVCNHEPIIYFSSVHSPFQCKQLPGPPSGSAVPPVGWHKLQPS